MFLKERNRQNITYLCPIFSDFEKNYLLSEIDMIIQNGGERFVFDNFETNRILVYFRKYCIGTCTGILTEILWQLLVTRITIDGVYYNSYLDFALKGATKDLDTGQITLQYDLHKIKEIFLEEDFLKLIHNPENNTDISRDFIESIKK